MADEVPFYIQGKASCLATTSCMAFAKQTLATSYTSPYGLHRMIF